MKKRVNFILVLLTFFKVITITNEGYSAEGIKSKTNTQKENKYMGVSFSQRYANVHRNSLVEEKIEGKGKNIKVLQITGRTSSPESTDFLLYDSGRGILCTTEEIYIVSLENGKTVNCRLKGRHSPVVCWGEKICYNKRLLSCIRPEESEYNTPLYRVAGHPGDFSYLSDLFPFDNYFISGVIAGPIPPNPSYKEFILGCGKYEENKNIVWSISFDKPIPPPPVCNLDGNIVIFHKGVLRLISAKDGTTLLEKSIDLEILSCSVGPNGRLYTVAKHEISHYLIEWDEKFNQVWSVEVLRLRWSQPPVTMKNGTVLLVGKGLICAFREGRQIWQYGVILTDDKYPFLATATGNNRIVVIGGNNLICLDENGKEVWVYRKESIWPLRTQPVVDKEGKIYVTDDKAIYIVW